MKKKERKNAGRKRAVTALKHSKRMLSVLLIFMMTAMFGLQPKSIY